MIFDLTGAAASRAASGDGAGTVIVPLVIAGLVVASWALRPAGRMLTPPQHGVLATLRALWIFVFGDHA